MKTVRLLAFQAKKSQMDCFYRLITPTRHVHGSGPHSAHLRPAVWQPRHRAVGVSPVIYSNSLRGSAPSAQRPSVHRLSPSPAITPACTGKRPFLLLSQLMNGGFTVRVETARRN